MVRIEDVANEREVGYYLQRHMDKHGKPPQILIVSEKAEKVGLPKKFEGLGVEILRRQYIFHPQIIIVADYV